MVSKYFNQKRISNIFAKPISKTALFEAEDQGKIPRGRRSHLGTISGRSWDIMALPQIGEHFGFIKKYKAPLAMSIFTTKGGVLKTTLTLNWARMAALHNIKTCVIGLDVQGDITTSMGHNEELEDCSDLKKVIERINQTKGLFDVFNRTTRLEDTIMPTELPSLFYIPETPELVALNESLNNINRREYWLKEKIIDPLKGQFDLILMDCSPNWNRLITNSLVGCDLLLSPLECKINNFRNFKVFRYFLNEFKKEMKLDFNCVFIPTRFSNSRKLTLEIRDWYIENIPRCTKNGVRESVSSEEAQALKISLPEHVATKKMAQEMRQLIIEVDQQIREFEEQKDEKKDDLNHNDSSSSKNVQSTMENELWP